MRRHWIVLVIVFSGLVTTWGCSRSSSQPVANISTSSQQAKITRLEQELKLVEVSRDEALKQIKELETKLKQQLSNLQNVEKERDELKNLLKTRTGERDALQVHFDGFRKNLKELVGQADAVYQLPSVPALPTSTQFKTGVEGKLLPLNKGS